MIFNICHILWEQWWLSSTFIHIIRPIQNLFTLSTWLIMFYNDFEIDVKWLPHCENDVHSLRFYFLDPKPWHDNHHRASAEFVASVISRRSTQVPSAGPIPKFHRRHSVWMPGQASCVSRRVRSKIEKKYDTPCGICKQSISTTVTRLTAVPIGWRW